MKVTCRHCGASNEAQVDPGRSVTVVCRSCGRPFNASDSQGPVTTFPDYGDFPDDSYDSEHGESTVAVDMNQLDISESGLELSDVTGAPSSRGSGGFAMPALGDLPPPPPGGRSSYHGANTMEPSTMRVDLDDIASSAGAFELGDVGGLGGPAQTLGWRVRNERGLVYNLVTIAAVTEWLAEKESPHTFEVAQGEGPFLPIAAVPALAERFGGIPHALVGESDGEEPALTLA